MASSEEPLCPSNFWKDESRYAERVLLVVHVDVFCEVKRIAEQIAWIERNVFPFSVFPERRLVLMGKRVQLVNHALEEPWEWEPFEDWQDLYRKLLVGGFFVQLPRAEHYFHAALFMNVREDATIGGGYALPEVEEERCIIRAMFLASRGNMLFGDWGWAVGYHPNVTHDDLRRTTILPTYIYESVSFKWYPVGRAGQALLLFLPHYLRPQYATVDGLTLRTMESIRDMVNGTLFDAYARRCARWNAYWWLYFADDGNLLEHQWSIGQDVHSSLINNYVTIRLWIGSSFYKAIFIDIGLFLLYGPGLFASVEFWVWSEPISAILVRAFLWFSGLQLVFFPLPQVTHRLFVEELTRWVIQRTALFLFLDRLGKFWWERFDVSDMIPGLGIYFSLAILDNISGIIILEDNLKRNALLALLVSPFAALVNGPRLESAVYFLAEQLLVWLPLATVIRYKIGDHQRFTFASQETIRSWMIVPACVVAPMVILKWL